MANLVSVVVILALVWAAMNGYAWIGAAAGVGAVILLAAIMTKQGNEP